MTASQSRLLVFALCENDGENWTYYVDSADMEIHLLYVKLITLSLAGIKYKTSLRGITTQSKYQVQLAILHRGALSY